MTSDTLHLWFSSSLQAYFIVDEYDWRDNIPFQAVLKSRTIPPRDSIEWSFPPYPQQIYFEPPLTSGSHILLGGVKGYGISDTARFTVLAPTQVRCNSPDAMSIALGQNYPNPFNGLTWVPFTLARESHESMSLCNSLGQSVRTVLTGEQGAGAHLVKIDLGGLPSGPYWCRLQVERTTRTIRLIYIK